MTSQPHNLASDRARAPGKRDAIRPGVIANAAGSSSPCFLPDDAFDLTTIDSPSQIPEELLDAPDTIRDEERHDLDDSLDDLEPPELRQPIVRRVGSSSFVTDEILSRFSAHLQRFKIDGTATLVDLGCGHGGVGLYLAEQTKARLIGVDVESIAIRRARVAARSFALEHLPLFECAPLEATYIEPSSVDAVISLDALHRANDPATAITEIHRILVDSGITCFNVYVGDHDAGAATWVRRLESAGFAMIDIDDQTDRWRAVMTARHRARIDHAQHLYRRFGQRAVTSEIAMSRMMLGLDHGPSIIQATRRVELVARKARRRSCALIRTQPAPALPSLVAPTVEEELEALLAAAPF